MNLLDARKIFGEPAKYVGSRAGDHESGGGRKSSGSGFDQRPAAEDNFAQSTEITDEDIPLTVIP